MGVVKGTVNHLWTTGRKSVSGMGGGTCGGPW